MHDQSVAPQRGTGLAFVQHWDWVAERGLMPRNTAIGIRAAVSQILKIEPDWESVDVRQLDIEAMLGRFHNLSRLAPNSLAAYESRFRSGLASYLAYLDSPTSYQPKVRKHASGQERPGSTPNKTKAGPQPVAEAPLRTTQVSSTGPTAKLVVYPFPVRPDVFAELKLPADLTAEEATRLGTFLKAVALTGDRGRE